MKQGLIIFLLALSLLPIWAKAQQDTVKTGKATDSADTITSSVKVLSIPAPAITDSNDERNFLEQYYYGPDMDGTYDIYDPWDIYPDRDEDSQERESDDRDGQQQDVRE